MTDNQEMTIKQDMNSYQANLDANEIDLPRENVSATVSPFALDPDAESITTLSPAD